jgi:hypothetical protein
MRAMDVVAAKIQTVEDIYRLVWTAVASKRPMEAYYEGRRRLFCPHRLGRNQRGDLRVLCSQYGGESDSGLQSVGFGGKLALLALEKLSQVKSLDGPWRTAPNHSRPTSWVIDADIDAEDHPARDPQKGQ